MDYAAARHLMVEAQLRPSRVTDPRVIDAMWELPREMFVPKQMRGIAYVDGDLDLGNGRYLMEPLVLARLIQAAEVAGTDVVLDIGCASGYSAAVLGKVASTVVAVEQDADLAKSAAAALSELSIDNVAVVNAPLAEGYPQQAPFDVILLDGAVAEIPQSLCAQLADGGRLVAVVQDKGAWGTATLVVRTGDNFSRRALFECGIHLLPGFQKDPGFVF